MSLKDRLLRRIAAEGPISLADYMAEALLDPTYGYYATRDPLGRAGDFTTAPEISQVFGELLGLWVAQVWQDQGAPHPFTLAELGPGRGTLMRDALRAAGRIPGFAPQVVLVEASPSLRAVQAETLKANDIRWLDGVQDLPDQPLFLLANEFFDALPIRQFRRDGPGWREIRLGASGGRLHPGLGQRQPQPALACREDDTRDGDIVEICPMLPSVMSHVAARIDRHGGAALVIDYGDWRSRGDTFQAVRGHMRADPFEAPGAADLTAHVDFEALARAAAPPLSATAMTAQGVFLERLGVTARAQALARSLTGPRLEELVAAHRRLTHPEEMGHLFKAMGFHPAASAPLPGLHP